MEKLLNKRRIVKCAGCGELKENHAKEMCVKCYKKFGWKKKLQKCNSCKRERPHHAHGLCSGCYMRLNNYDSVKAYNVKKYYEIDYDLYNEVKKTCVSCGFSKIVHLHHLDGDNKNNSKKNLVGLCPNCHKMIHSYDFYKEIKDILEIEGYDVEKVHPSNYTNRKDEKKLPKT